MSRNKNVDYTQYVHEFVDDHGVTRFAVAKEQHPFFIVPCDKQDNKLGVWGIHQYFELNLISGYLTRKQALRRARYLFGGK